MSNTTALVSPEGRAVYVQVTTAQKSQLNPSAEAKYTIKVAFPPTADLSELKGSVQNAANARFPNGIPEEFKLPWRKNSSAKVEGIPDDWTIITFSCRESSGRPGVVGPDIKPIMDSSQLYSGMWVQVQYNPYTYPKESKPGITPGAGVGLQNVMKVRDDEPLRGAKPRPEAVFKPVAGAASAGGGAGKPSIFD